MRAPKPAAGAAIALSLLLPLLAGCATGGNPRDPFESFNRPVHAFNDALDRHALRPVAVGYRRFVPEPIRLVFSSFVSNLGDLYIGLNNLLQAKPKAALVDVSRFVVNSTIGVGGLADVASEIGLTKHNEDFGQTLGRWGVPAGPYLVLPFFGPSNLRDAPSRLVDVYGDPVAWYDGSIAARNTVIGLRYVDARAQLLDADRLLEDALDRYALLRDAYLQRRRNQVYDGDPPDDSDYKDDSGYGEDPYADDPTKDEPGKDKPAGSPPGQGQSGKGGSAGNGPASGGPPK